MFIDRSLALACELGERDGLRRCMQAGQRNFPELGIDTLDLAGGILTFSGAPGSLSEGVAIGVESDVSELVVDEITSFFGSHQCPARVTISPITDPELARLLARAGYVPVESQNTLVASVDGTDPDAIARRVDPAVAPASRMAACVDSRTHRASERCGNAVRSALGGAA